jgi:hypothetical protein
MARTFGGLIFYGAENLNFPSANNGGGAGQYNWVQNADGTLTLNNTAGVSTVTFQMGIAEVKRPYFIFPTQPGQGTILVTNEFNEAFGTTPATPGAAGPGNPFSGIASGSNANQTTQFGSPQMPFGLALVDVFAVYSVQTAGLTTATLAVNRLRYAENTAVTIDAVLAATGVALTTTTSASTPHVQKVSLAQPLIFEQADFSNLAVSFLITTAATSAVRVYGIGAHVAVEYS